MDEFCAWARYARLEELLTLHPTHSCLTEHAAPYEKIVGGTAAAPLGQPTAEDNDRLVAELAQQAAEAQAQADQGLTDATKARAAEVKDVDTATAPTQPSAHVQRLTVLH